MSRMSQHKTTTTRRRTFAPARSVPTPTTAELLDRTQAMCNASREQLAAARELLDRAEAHLNDLDAATVEIARGLGLPVVEAG